MHDSPVNQQDHTADGGYHRHHTTRHRQGRTVNSMMALRAHRRGGPEVLRYESAPTPTPAPGEVQIRVHAAAITFAELTWDETWTRNGVDRTPTIPSHEVSGVITELGECAHDLHIADEVYGLIPFDRNGAAAEFVTAPTDVVAPNPPRRTT